MSATYETEQKQLEARVSELEAAIAEAREQRLNVDSFLGMVRRYTDKKADLGHLVELYRRGRYPATRAKRNGIAYMIVSYAVSFLTTFRP